MKKILAIFAVVMFAIPISAIATPSLNQVAYVQHTSITINQNGVHTQKYKFPFEIERFLKDATITNVKTAVGQKVVLKHIGKITFIGQLTTYNISYTNGTTKEPAILLVNYYYLGAYTSSDFLMFAAIMLHLYQLRLSESKIYSGMCKLFPTYGVPKLFYMLKYPVTNRDMYEYVSHGNTYIETKGSLSFGGSYSATIHLYADNTGYLGGSGNIE